MEQVELLSQISGYYPLLGGGAVKDLQVRGDSEDVKAVRSTEYIKSLAQFTCSG